MKQIRQWRCGRNHILGMVVENGNGVPQLMVLRHAIDDMAEMPAEVDVMIGPVTGAMQVQCEICGEVMPWKVSVESMLYLVENMPANLLFEFWKRLLERAKEMK